MKDNFSTQSDKYLRYRPKYPFELVDLIVSHCENKERVWDVGTGNGQLAGLLSEHFTEVKATDISENQLVNAIQKSNIDYSVQPAETPTFSDSSFDLIVVAQALHWFDLNKFYDQVNRLLKPDGVFAAIGYTLTRIEGVDECLFDFYKNKVGSFWNPERMLVQEEYRTIDFPFDQIGDFSFEIKNEWSFEDFIGYLKTWSAVKHYQEENGSNPVEEWREEFKDAWGDAPSKDVVTPVFLRLGRLTEL